jgi:hypothetical protein
MARIKINDFVMREYISVTAKTIQSSAITLQLNANFKKCKKEKYENTPKCKWPEKEVYLCNRVPLSV